MGQRAHNRRHEGRAIRKERRELMADWASLPSIAESMNAFAEGFMTGMISAIEKLKDAFAGFSEAMFGYSFGHDVVIVPESSPRQMLIAGDEPVITPSQKTAFESFIGHQVLELPPRSYTYEEQRALREEYLNAKKPAPSED